VNAQAIWVGGKVRLRHRACTSLWPLVTEWYLPAPLLGLRIQRGENKPKPLPLWGCVSGGYGGKTAKVLLKTERRAWRILGVEAVLPGKLDSEGTMKWQATSSGCPYPSVGGGYSRHPKGAELCL
jgi:hypothetical protein